MRTDKSIDQQIADSAFRKELTKLRKILLGEGLQETVKWGGPVYTYDGRNIAGIAAFKEHFGVWFFQGGLLQDPKGKLLNAQEGKTKAMRQWRMTSDKDIDIPQLKSFIREAIENEKKGVRMKAAPAIKEAPPLPAELSKAIGRSAKLKTAFEKLTPGKQKEYAEYIAGARREETRLSRIEKITPMILAGQGLNDRYKK